MRLLFSLCAVCLILSGLAGEAVAHRVNVFAYVDGDLIHVECGFSRSQKVRQGKIEIFDAASGQKVGEGTTDDAGVFRFPVPAGLRESGHDVRIRLVAGEGHQNEWLVAADELKSASSSPTVPASTSSASSSSAAAEAVSTSTVAPTSQAATAAAPVALSQNEVLAPEKAKSTAAGAVLSAAEAERIINTALDAKLAPIKRMLAEQTEAGPSLRDIIGGIGWIFGLMGVAAYFRRRP